MITTQHQPVLYDPEGKGNKRFLSSRLFLLAILISLLLHGVFLYYSQQWQVADVHKIEEGIETLFKVQLRDLESENFVSRPTHMQLREERDRVLQQDIQNLAERPVAVMDSQVESQIAALNPSLGEEALPDTQESAEQGRFQQDQSARELISSEISQRSMQSFEAASNIALPNVVPQNKRIPLTGRGRGTQNRILANLPEPAERADPVVSQSIDRILNQTLAPNAPQLDIEQPPIELPPVNEILPSPELVRPSIQPTTFKDVEAAIEERGERYIQLDDLLDVQLYTYHHIGGEGYFMVQIRPVAQDERLRVLPKDVVFVVDASASMGSRRISVLKKEIRALMQRLRPEDRFNIVGFKQDIKKFTNNLAPVNEETLKKGWQFLNPLEASGRTDIYTSLQPIVQLGTERARPLIMMLYSDGRPTVGVTNSRNIINNLSKFLGPSTSIFCIGTGDKINRYLLDMLAFRNRGMVAFEKNRSELPLLMQSVYGYIEDPVLLKVQAHFEGIDQSDVYPKRLPDLYLKGDIRIWGRLKGERNITLRMVGEAFDEQKEIIVRLPVPEIDNATYEIAREWAFHKAYHLVGRMVQEGERPELIEEIRDISRTYRIGTPYSEESGIR